MAASVNSPARTACDQGPVVAVARSARQATHRIASARINWNCVLTTALAVAFGNPPLNAVIGFPRFARSNPTVVTVSPRSVPESVASVWYTACLPAGSRFINPNGLVDPHSPVASTTQTASAVVAAVTNGWEILAVFGEMASGADPVEVTRGRQLLLVVLSTLPVARIGHPGHLPQFR